MTVTNSHVYEKKLQDRNPAGLSSPLLWGLAGGFAGTLVMDLILMTALWLAGLEPLGCFSMVGTTVRRMLGLSAGEGLTAVAAGVATHYSVGPALGLIFGIMMRRVRSLQGASFKRILVTAALYVELASQPMLVTVPVLLRLSRADTVTWYAGSTVMHLICALVLGAVVWHGPRLPGRHAAYKAPDSTQPSPNHRGGRWALRIQAVTNLLRMGHCAPTVMQTLLDVSGERGEWLVKLSAGMPGGIGNTGHECGALTSPLVLLGLRYGLREMDRGLPVLVDQGHAHCQQFLASHRTLLCKQIRQRDRFPRHCMRPVCMSPELLQETLTNHDAYAIPAEARASYCRLYSHMTQRHFHCAHEVLERLPFAAPDRQRVLDATSAFMGGTLFMGLTCSALTAGVMALGLRSGEIENSRLKVARMLMRMTFGGDALDERINKCNRTMNAGYRMSRWFSQEFGSTQCRAITQCDFATSTGVDGYIAGDYVTQCSKTAQRVAERVQGTLEELMPLAQAAA